MNSSASSDGTTIRSWVRPTLCLTTLNKPVWVMINQEAADLMGDVSPLRNGDATSRMSLMLLTWRRPHCGEPAQVQRIDLAELDQPGLVQWPSPPLAKVG